MLDKTNLSFIIVNYRSERYLKKCVASLFDKIKDVNFEIIIVNNDENNLIELENAKIINPKKNVGFGKANNIGAQKAVGEFLCFLNPDTLLISENIKEIVKEFEKDSEIGAIGPKILNKFNKSQEWSAGTKVNLWDLIKNNLGFKKSRKIWESKIKKEADWVSGAAFFIPCSLFLKLGGF
ncbi:glycosyltransferase, partial [bacterium]|nr:glycosyltransferase [bacterium]